MSFSCFPYQIFLKQFILIVITGNACFYSVQILFLDSTLFEAFLSILLVWFVLQCTSTFGWKWH